MKPKTTWQVYDPIEDKLTVHVSDDPTSEIYFEGKPEDYDGSATEPAAPTSQFLEKARK
jgi:hypothetical protein